MRQSPEFTAAAERMSRKESGSVPARKRLPTLGHGLVRSTGVGLQFEERDSGVSSCIEVSTVPLS
jgi:hypothetical protein